MEKIRILFLIIALCSVSFTNSSSFQVEQKPHEISYSEHENFDRQKVEPEKKRFELFSLLGFITTLVAIIGLISGVVGLWGIASIIAVIFATISHFRFEKNKLFKGRIFNIFSWINFMILILFAAFIIFILMSIQIQCASF